MSSQIGRKILLHTNSFPDRPNDAPDTFIAIEIVEVKPVKGSWSGEPNEGWKAKGDDGHFWFVNWETFDDASMSPCWRWHCPELQKSAFDIEQGMWAPIPQRPKFLDKYDFMGYCEEHKKLYNKSDDVPGMCFECWLEKQNPERARLDREKKAREEALKPKPWNGWF